MMEIYLIAQKMKKTIARVLPREGAG